MERVILDAGILIAAERGNADLSDELRRSNDDVCISAISAAELLQGVELADGQRRERRQAFIEGVLALVPVEEYTLTVARTHARLLAHVRREGRPRGAHDLIIAATAAATARTVVTLDAKARFGDLPGVSVREVG
ncbi:PIN domain-containing protein [Streptomyces sp. 35G-GA-8]|uniref:PIN domain-containing protein n=1 Tax=Streptomyces sp. 35G-GA-8 TaxID=2939434 RepID=UPI00201F6261|nr:PIN domain-containing protein [Streptomyces sp. 35G-GA-8]MCL7376050.1 PIN domain-containing protein [Streptomyces sp. 35G-GA-8]